MTDNNPHDIYESPFEPDDTQPNATTKMVAPPGEDSPGIARQVLAFVMLLVAVGFTIAAAVVLLLPQDEPDPIVVSAPTNAPVAVAPTVLPTEIPVIVPVVDSAQEQPSLPIIDAVLADALLKSPLFVADSSKAGRIEAARYNPFTIIPDRPRNQVIQYTVVQGDTIDEIAEFFGLESESIAWSNPRRIIQVLRAGDVLNIPPVDGVYIEAVGSTRTISYYADYYKVDDAYLILDSPFNDFVGLTADTVPASGTKIFIPGGEGEQLDWAAGIEIIGGDTTSGGGNVGTVVFQNGDPGSCAPQPISGGTFWINPMGGGYSVTQWFGTHTGIDLGAAEGTPVMAANGGRVIFAGWNSWGYGYMVAMIHGSYMTVYGHLSAVYVGCGQEVASGTVIGAVGNTGNSSGPHLHFEIRVRQGSTYVPQNPAFTIGF
jgi:murein DD-endopeptidase MepM/ murein hydrolase activator NlpD